MTAIPDRLSAALSDRYRLERELGQGGMEPSPGPRRPPERWPRVRVAGRGQLTIVIDHSIVSHDQKAH